MKYIKSFVFGLTALTLLAYTATAQRRKTPFEAYSTVGFGVGTSSYVGDLAPYSRPVETVFKMMRWNVNAAYTRNFTPRLAARASFMWARIAGDDETFNRGGKPLPANYLRNLHFRNDLKEFAVVGIFKFKADGRSPNRRANFTPYLFGGIAALAHNPKAKTPIDYVEGSKWVSLQPLGTEGQGQPGYDKPYSLVTYAVPVGIGFKWKVNNDWDFAMEGGIRFTGSDYLDDASTSYPDPAVLRNDLAVFMSNRSGEEIAARTGKDRIDIAEQIIGQNPNLPIPDVGLPRGNPNRKDAYLISSFQLIYTLPSKIKCPPIR